MPIHFKRGDLVVYANSLCTIVAIVPPPRPPERELVFLSNDMGTTFGPIPIRSLKRAEIRLLFRNRKAFHGHKSVHRRRHPR